MASFASFGNRLYTGERSIDFIGRQKIWYAASGVLIEGLNDKRAFEFGHNILKAEIAIPSNTKFGAI